MYFRRIRRFCKRRPGKHLYVNFKELIYSHQFQRKKKCLVVKKKSKLLGTPGKEKHHVEVGDKVEVIVSEDEEGMVKVKTKGGILGELLVQNLGK